LADIHKKYKETGIADQTKNENIWKANPMIVLLNRQEIPGLNKTFASHIIDWQEQIYNPSLGHSKYKAGMMYDLNFNKSGYY
jgi:hypothetical protein